MLNSCKHTNQVLDGVELNKFQENPDKQNNSNIYKINEPLSSRRTFSAELTAQCSVTETESSIQ